MISGGMIADNHKNYAVQSVKAAKSYAQAVFIVT